MNIPSDASRWLWVLYYAGMLPCVHAGAEALCRAHVLIAKPFQIDGLWGCCPAAKQAR